LLHLVGSSVLLHIKCVFWFSLQSLSETLLTLRRIQEDIIINVHRSSCKLPFILVKFLSNLNFLCRFSRNNQISRKYFLCESYFSMRMDRQTYDEAINRYLQFCERAPPPPPKKKSSYPVGESSRDILGRPDRAQVTDPYVNARDYCYVRVACHFCRAGFMVSVLR